MRTTVSPSSTGVPGSRPAGAASRSLTTAPGSDSEVAVVDAVSVRRAVVLESPSSGCEPYCRRPTEASKHSGRVMTTTTAPATHAWARERRGAAALLAHLLGRAPRPGLQPIE